MLHPLKITPTVISDFKNAFSYTFLINTYLELAQTLTSGAGKPSLKQGRESKSTEKSEFSAAQRVYLVFIFHEVRTFGPYTLAPSEISSEFSLTQGPMTKSKNKSSTSKLSVLQQKFAKKLEGSRFRVINERLYTTSGDVAFKEFQCEPRLFDVYHEGFRAQAAQWPENPLDAIIGWIRKKHPRATIADMGCGDAREQCSKNIVHSFDLVSVNSYVTACDIAHTPLADGSVDIVVFCLSLMGTNIGDFLKEAYRILRIGGTIKICEVRSRFEGETDGVKKFLRVLKRAGFDLHGGITHKQRHDGNNKMFFDVEARKSARGCAEDLQYRAKACIYKRR
eukprot:GSChrysophyteH1.ASY1.ANO1.2995.1 assembled CDS